MRYDGDGMKATHIFLRTALTVALTVSSGTAAPTTNTVPSADLKILSRADWGAKPAGATMKTHTPSRITIHHTAVLQKPDRSLKDKLQALQQFHSTKANSATANPSPRGRTSRIISTLIARAGSPRAAT